MWWRFSGAYGHPDGSSLQCRVPRFPGGIAGNHPGLAVPLVRSTYLDASVVSLVGSRTDGHKALPRNLLLFLKPFEIVNSGIGNLSIPILTRLERGPSDSSPESWDAELTVLPCSCRVANQSHQGQCFHYEYILTPLQYCSTRIVAETPFISMTANDG